MEGKNQLITDLKLKINKLNQNILDLESLLQKNNALIDNLPDLFILIDLNGKILLLNNAMAKSLGETKENLIGNNILNYFPPEVAKYRTIMAHKLIKTKKPIAFEDKRDGRWFKTKLFPVFNSEGNVIQIANMVEEITEQKEIELSLEKTEHILKESEHKFRDLAEQSPNMIFINNNGKIAYVNQKSSEILGYKYDEFFDDDFNFFTLIAPESHDTVKNAYKKHMDGKDILPLEYNILTKDGNKINALITTKLIEYEGKSSILGIVTDLTQIKKAEQKIKTTKDHLQSVLDSASEIIFTIGSDYKIKTWNKSARMITGYTQPHIVGISIKNLTLFQNQDELKDYIQTIFKGKKATLEELTINTSFGIKRVFSVSPSFMLDESKNVYEILFICKDITNEKERNGKLIFGQSYLVSEATSETAVEIFAGMLRARHPGLFISRTSDSEIKNIFTDVTPTIVKLSNEKDKKYPTCFNFEELLSTIKDYVSKEKQSIVLLDRIEYLIINSSFESVIKNIYLLNDIIGKYNCMLLLRISPSLLDKTQMVILKEELHQLPERQIDDVQLEETLFEILDYIQIENRKNAILSYSRIGKKFSISKVTTQRRIESLLEKGLVFSKKQGRSKTLYITYKGKNLLNHRLII